MKRFSVRVAYRETLLGRAVEKPFSNVKLEISAYEGTHLAPEVVPAYSLRPFGINGPSELPCIPLVKQIAQKLHAVTERRAEGRSNDRFRDLLDIVLLSAMVPPSPELRGVCEETFRLRQKHAWPPEVVAYPSWIGPLEDRARDMNLDKRSAEEIVGHVVQYVADISRA